MYAHTRQHHELILLSKQKLQQNGHKQRKEGATKSAAHLTVLTC